MTDLLDPVEKPSKAKPVTTPALEAALLKSFALPEYATFFEVGDGTGSAQRQWADAVSMACWPSRGLVVLGFELKVSRSDWLREKKKPTKSMAVQKYCDRWYLVTGPNVTSAEEIPELWGWMEFVGGKMFTRKAAPQLTPEPLDKPFIAALLRRAGQYTQGRIANALEELRAKELETFEARVEDAVKRRTQVRSDAIDACKAFQEASGIDLLSWRNQAQEVGQEFAAFRRISAEVRYESYEVTARKLRIAADACDAAKRQLVEAGLVPVKEA